MAAATVLWYLDVRDEVRTTAAVTAALADETQKVVVPYCVGEQLHLFELRGFDELAIGRFGIREPAEPLRSDPARMLDIAALDVIVVPGVALTAEAIGWVTDGGFTTDCWPGVEPIATRSGWLLNAKYLTESPSNRTTSRLTKSSPNMIDHLSKIESATVGV